MRRDVEQGKRRHWKQSRDFELPIHEIIHASLYRDDCQSVSMSEFMSCNLHVSPQLMRILTETSHYEIALLITACLLTLADTHGEFAGNLM